MTVISAWGLPKGWRKVKYKYEEKGIVVESKSTLPLLERVFEDERKVVVLPITLADGKGDLKSAVLERVEEGLKDDSKALEAFKNSEKVIIPGRGKFMSNNVLKEFEAPTETIISSMVLKLFDLINENVLLDITHGVNFYPVTLRGTLEKLMRIKSLGKKSKMEVGSSDPFYPSKEDITDVTLSFRKLESLNISTTLSELPELVGEVRSLVKGSFEKKWKEVKVKLLRSFRGLKAGSPLYWSYLLVRLYKDTKLKGDVEELWDEVLKLIDESYEVMGDKVLHKVTVYPEAAFALAAYKSLYSFAKEFSKTEHFLLDKVFLVNFKSLEELEPHLSAVERSLWLIEKSKLGNAFQKDLEGIRLDAINTIREISSNLNEVRGRVKGKLKERLKELSDDEINTYLEELLSIMVKDKVVPYGVVESEDDLEEALLWWVAFRATMDKHKDEVARNFLAHAGAEKNVTLLRKSGDLKLVGYYIPAMNALENVLMNKLKAR